MGQFHLFECISAMKKGPPGSYYAETSDEALTQKAVPGEPNERLSLYRIRRPQETYQLLHQDRRGSGGRTGPLGCATFDAARVGCGANPSLARGHGRDAIQRWIYDTLKPYATCLEMAHPLMLKEIGRAHV